MRTTPFQMRVPHRVSQRTTQKIKSKCGPLKVVREQNVEYFRIVCYLLGYWGLLGLFDALGDVGLSSG